MKEKKHIVLSLGIGNFVGKKIFIAIFNSF